MSEAVEAKMLLTEEDLTALGLGGRSTIRKFRESGELVPLKLGKSVRYRRADVMAFINKMAEVQNAGHNDRQQEGTISNDF